MIKGTFREFQKEVCSWKRGEGSSLIYITNLNPGVRMGIGYDYRKVCDRTWNWKYVLTLAGDVEIGGFIFLPLINTHFSQLSFPHVKWSNITSRAPPFPGAVLCTRTMYFVHRRYTLHTQSLHRLDAYNLESLVKDILNWWTFLAKLQHWAIHVQGFSFLSLSKLRLL